MVSKFLGVRYSKAPLYNTFITVVVEIHVHILGIWKWLVAARDLFFVIVKLHFQHDQIY